MPAPSHYQPVLEYIRDFWPKLTRFNTSDEETRIGLPAPYVVPGVGAMFQEMYYWDSYFTALGLAESESEQLVLDMTENMAWLLDRFGMIPNGSRYYFLSRSQPPFFTRMVLLAWSVLERRGNVSHEWLAAMLDLAEGEHARVWHGTRQPHHRLVHEGLSRYFDINFLDMLASCESGWDHSTRCDDRWLSFLPVDLNSILYARERDMAQMARLLGQPDRAAGWDARAATRAETMRRVFWDAEKQFFFDYDYIEGTLNPTVSLAGFYPLWAGLATPEQAATVVREWLPKLEQPGGLVTSLDARQGRQWAWPMGWAPLQYIVVEGLETYGYRAESDRIRAKWCDTCAAMYERTGVLWEKYNVVDPGSDGEEGLYGHVTGFGWTNGVFVDFARKLAGG